MKRLFLLILLAFSIPTLAEDTTFDWSGLERSQISLEAPLLIVKGSLGFLGCGYINTDSCIDEACAIVSGVNTHNGWREDVHGRNLCIHRKDAYYCK